jgi:hypothetical protein
MAEQTIDWVPVTGNTGVRIGALGFIGNDVAVVAAFFDDRDGNQDGRVSWGEAVVAFMSPIKLDGRAVTEVAMAARTDPGIILRDATFAQEAARMFVAFAGNLIKDGLYTVYFSRAVKAAGAGIATRMAEGLVKQFVIRKGFETAVKKAYDAAMKQGAAY